MVMPGVFRASKGQVNVAFVGDSVLLSVGEFPNLSQTMVREGEVGAARTDFHVMESSVMKIIFIRNVEINIILNVGTFHFGTFDLCKVARRPKFRRLKASQNGL